MKVCHLTSVHNRRDSRIFSKECVSLQRAGYDVALVVADNNGYEEKNGIKIYGVSANSNRLFRMWLATKRVYLKAIELDADIYHLHDPELIPTGIKLKKKGKKVIFDSHEDVPQQIIGSKDYIPSFIRKILSYLYAKYEAKTIRKFDAIISVSPNIVERLKQINPNTVLVTNYPIIKELLSNTQKTENTICFAGLISALWMHTNILSALSLLNGVKYNLAGVVEPKYLQKLQIHNSWKQVNYVGRIAPDEVFGFLQSSAIGMALCDYSIEVGYNMGTLGNTKLFEYMQAGIPIICTDFILWKQIIEEEKCGVCVNPRDVKSIVTAIKYIFSNSEKAKEMGIAGQKAVKEKYNWVTQEKALLNLYNCL